MIKRRRHRVTILVSSLALVEHALCRVKAAGGREIEQGADMLCQGVWTQFYLMVPWV